MTIQEPGAAATFVSTALTVCQLPRKFIEAEEIKQHESEDSGTSQKKICTQDFTYFFVQCNHENCLRLDFLNSSAESP